MNYFRAPFRRIPLINVMVLAFALVAFTARADSPHDHGTDKKFEPDGANHPTLRSTKGHPQADPGDPKPGPISTKELAEYFFKNYQKDYANLLTGFDEWEKALAQLKERGKQYPAPDAPSEPDLRELEAGLKVMKKVLLKYGPISKPLPGAEVITPAVLENLHDLNGAPDKTSAMVDLQLGLLAMQQIAYVLDYAQQINKQLLNEARFDTPVPPSKELAHRAAQGLAEQYENQLFDPSSSSSEDKAVKDLVSIATQLNNAYAKPIAAEEAKEALRHR